jgi:Mg2+ and Co2+ transporter CorA
MEKYDFKKHEIEYILTNIQATAKSIENDLFNKTIDHKDTLVDIKELSKNLVRMIKNIESMK